MNSLNLTNNLSDFLTRLSIYHLDQEVSYDKIFLKLTEPGIDCVSYTFEINPGIYYFKDYFPFCGILLNSSDLIQIKNIENIQLILDNKIIPSENATGYLPIRHMTDVKVEFKSNISNIKVQGFALSVENRVLLKKILQKENTNGAGICFLNNKFKGIYKSPPNKEELEHILHEYYSHEFD